MYWLGYGLQCDGSQFNFILFILPWPPVSLQNAYWFLAKEDFPETDSNWSVDPVLFDCVCTTFSVKENYFGIDP